MNSMTISGDAHGSRYDPGGRGAVHREISPCIKTSTGSMDQALYILSALIVLSVFVFLAAVRKRPRRHGTMRRTTSPTIRFCG
jgi:hypothetical protein